MPEDDEDDEEALPHSEAVDVFQEGLAMVVQDPLLCDLPIQVRDRALDGHPWSHQRRTLLCISGKFGVRGPQNTPSQA